MSTEYVLSPSVVILSTADLRGNVTSFNQTFLDASGYTEAELMGKPHSILRHSDMPKEAFKDFWDTIQDGRPWFGLVKNKRKNGDFYWVAANASPIFSNGQITGYVSVRYAATNEQKALGERLYAQIRSNQAKMPWTPKPRLDTTLIISGLLGVVAAGMVMFFDNIGQTLGAVLGLSAFGIALWRGHRLSQPSDVHMAAIHGLANGDYRLPIAGHDAWANALNLLRTRAGQNASNALDAARDSAMLTTAMNAASTNLMVADADFNIISINTSLASMFARNESAIKSSLPQFNAATIVGSNMDIFHKDPSHQRAMVARLTQPWTGELKIAGLVLKMTVVPVVNNELKVGYVVEWLDRTEEALIVADIESVAQNMRMGVFNKRVEANATGALKAIKDNINSATSSIESIIHSIVDVVSAQAQGDLTKELPSGVYHGEFHDLKNAMSYSMQRMRDSVIVAIEASKIVNQASSQVLQGSSDLSARVQEQAAALEQTSATMTEMTSAVQANTANARKVSDLAQQVQVNSVQGVSVMQQTITAMRGISDSSHKMSEIVSLIDTIAFQTNLLALNAAVEAARAGEHGRGFAVVASEVRALAQKSAAAAKDIKTLIDESVNRVNSGTQLAEKSGDMLGGITEAVKQVAAMIGEIADASAEQSQGIGQVHQAIAQIDSVTQQNAALVEETTAAAESLSSEAQGLSQNMSFFKVGQTPASSHSAAKRLTKG